jgi:hypothetical protein
MKSLKTQPYFFCGYDSDSKGKFTFLIEAKKISLNNDRKYSMLTIARNKYK